MEKTVLYSKKSFPLSIPQNEYEQCEHEHCKKLTNHIKFLSNLLTQKIFKHESNTIKISTNKSIQSKLSNKLLSYPNTQKIIKDNKINSKFHINHNKTNQSLQQHQHTTSIQEQITIIKKNYLGLKKQLLQLQHQNDELYEENDKYKKKVQKLEEMLLQYKNKKDQQQLNNTTMTKCNQISAIESKNSFYLKDNHILNDGINEQNKNLQSFQMQLLLNPLMCTNNKNSPINPRKLSQHHSNNPALSPYLDPSDIAYFSNKYTQLLAKYNELQKQFLIKQKKCKQLNQKISLMDKFYEQNLSLKRIIKIRNQNQNKRNNLVEKLKNVLDVVGY